MARALAGGVLIRPRGRRRPRWQIGAGAGGFGDVDKKACSASRRITCKAEPVGLAAKSRGVVL
jgi:hypothetical protein